MSSRKYAKRIVVDLDTQTLKAYEGADVVFAFDCVTGDKNHPTDAGTFHVFQKDKNHISHAYNVPMHYAMFFTHDGKALHQYHGLVPLAIVRALKESVTDYLGSHGCVRMTEADAKVLFDWTPVGTAVQIQGRLT
jgi:lipoprotein-anchoring transpeptidase ErfK/SrfK